MRTLFILATILFSGIAFGQTDSITMKKGFGTLTFYQHGSRIGFSKATNIIKTNSLATPYVKKAKAANGVGIILGTAGGALIGFPLGTALGGGDPNWTLAFAGGGLVIASAFAIAQ